MTAWKSLWKDAGILHRDISSGNILMGRRENGDLQGYPIDFDHSVYVKDRNSNSGEPKEPSSALHRTGTAPFMALDHLSTPITTSPLVFPPWHLPRFDIESFIWVLCWTMHHFKMPRNTNEPTAYREWGNAPIFDNAFHDDDRGTARAKKMHWARVHDQNSGEIDPSWNSLVPLMWKLVAKVVTAYDAQDAFLAPKVTTDALATGGDVEMDDIPPVVPGTPVTAEFIEMGGSFKVDDVIDMVADFYNQM